jgi:hypothetical protein
MGKKIRVCLSAYWGNGGDAGSSLTISYAAWKSILSGEQYSDDSEGYYEGHRFSTYWSFNDPDEHWMYVTTGDGFVGCESGEKVFADDLDNISKEFFYLRNNKKIYIDEQEAEQEQNV